jgi:hypothetical protein
MRIPALAIATLAACQPPGSATPTTRPAPPPHQYALVDLVGGWRWMLRTTEAGTTRVEDELWRFRPRPGAPTQLVGRYVRSVDVRSDDRVPFQCNQRPWYRQRAVFDVAVEITRTAFAVTETEYHAEASPCDHGFRHVGAYTAELAGDRLVLRWGGGMQALSQIDTALAPLPDDPWPATPQLHGAWRWDATSFDDEGNVHDESEWWQLTRRTDTRLDATYRRRVTVRSPDGKTPIPCANAPSWTFDDAYVLDGQREEEHWHLYELAATITASAADRPCLRATPRRNLDEATAEQLGDYLILEWRGKRRQILYRDDAAKGPGAGK